MFKDTRLYRRLMRSIAFVILLAFALIPKAFATPHSQTTSFWSGLVGPKQHYLALGDSYAFGFQPNGNYKDGYASEFFENLQGHGVKNFLNLGCGGETTSSMIHGPCPGDHTVPTQLKAALDYLKAHAGQVRPVTLDIGVNDILGAINSTKCTVSKTQFNTALATVDTNLTKTILPSLHEALVVKGKLTGDLLVMNYYDEFQNKCPDS